MRHEHRATNERWPDAMKGHTVVDVIVTDVRKTGLVLDCGYVWFPAKDVNTGGGPDLWPPDTMRMWLADERATAQRRIDEIKRLEVIEALRAP